MQRSITSTTMNNIIITDSAAKRINYLLQKEEPSALFRISVQGGGCSGFKYTMDFDTNINEDDHIFEKNGIKIVVDDMSLQNFMHGSILDYIEDLGGANFEIKNPNTTAKCGCGNSFSI